MILTRQLNIHETYYYSNLYHQKMLRYRSIWTKVVCNNYSGVCVIPGTHKLMTMTMTIRKMQNSYTASCIERYISHSYVCVYVLPFMFFFSFEYFLIPLFMCRLMQNSFFFFAFHSRIWHSLPLRLEERLLLT